MHLTSELMASELILSRSTILGMSAPGHRRFCSDPSEVSDVREEQIKPKPCRPEFAEFQHGLREQWWNELTLVVLTSSHGRQFEGLPIGL